MKVLAIIPARGGSKGVKDKNIRLVAGQPLISYAIQCAKESQKLTRTIVSTDSDTIAKVSEEWGGEVLMRPSDLAQDETPIVPVIAHILEELHQHYGEIYDVVILLQPTSPIRTGEDIDKVIQMLEDDESVEGIISVVPMDDVHPARMYNLDKEQWMHPFLDNGETAQRQELPVVYYRNGCIYAVRTASFKKNNSLMVAKKKAYVMPLKQLANVDDERDLIITDLLVKHWKEGKL